MNARFAVDVTWQHPSDQMTSGPIFLRAMIVYSDPAELDTPVMRCPNHRDKEKTIENNGNGTMESFNENKPLFFFFVISYRNR
jgi:hypothetical protein